MARDDDFVPIEFIYVAKQCGVPESEVVALSHNDKAKLYRWANQEWDAEAAEVRAREDEMIAMGAYWQPEG